ncbi:hypothetical protein FOZ60_008707 [Perkinsus olseni]|uniref:Uncharacterized protein n=1 Tax=Perkinsus olseni TaxID=32597 RepID=A0A7J6PDM5_PEROL|nr:hypothetical protein FOZ60_008707 [Perkinsus olseni]
MILWGLCGRCSFATEDRKSTSGMVLEPAHPSATSPALFMSAIWHIICGYRTVQLASSSSLLAIFNRP